jgi:hypothetical protein
MQAAMTTHDEETAARVMADVVELSRQEMAARMMSGGVAP